MSRKVASHANFASAVTESMKIDNRDLLLVGLHTDAAWALADITFEAAESIAGAKDLDPLLVWKPIKDESGTTILIPGINPDEHVTFDPVLLAGAEFVRVVSSVAQTDSVVKFVVLTIL